MDQYINLLRFVRARVKAACTKGEIKYVTNRIITDLRATSAFEQTVLAFEVSLNPVRFTSSSGCGGKQQLGIVTLNKGIEIYYGVSYI